MNLIGFCRWATLLIMSSMLFVGNSPQTLAASVAPVSSYTLQCDETFSCPESLLPRVSFWVEVFSRWDTNTAIFHDKENPHRVYSTMTRNNGCRRSRKGDSVDKERRRLKSSLEAIAARMEQGKALTQAQKELQALFVGQPAREIRSASKRIRCQSGNKNRMREALRQFQLYRPTILDALESQNLTPELQYLPFVESAFNPNALSHVGAAGLWQIMPQTGRSLGLQVNNAVDERYDPKSATYAAALYFRRSVDDLSNTAFENGFSVVAKDLNPFVITSYNYGVRGMQRAIKQVGLDYERLLREYKSPNFQIAVKNFYASFLAARHVAKNAQRFFGVIDPGQSPRGFSYNTATLKHAVSAKRITAQLGVDKTTLDDLNPALKRAVWRNDALVPARYQLKLPYREGGWDKQLAAMYALPREEQKAGFIWHRVRRGQTACGIAEQYRASCRALRKLNRLDRKGTIYVGKRIKVPSRSGISQVASSGSSGAATERYRVRRGDTSCSIANRFGMLCGEFLAINGLTRKSVIQIGQRVTVTAADKWHTVRRGQTACEIAESYRVGCSKLLSANRLKRSSTLQIGQRLRVPNR